MPVTTNTWLGATAAQPPLAAQPNAFLGIHTTQMLYTGTVQAAQTTAGAGTTNSNSLYIAQSFLTGASQTAIGYVLLNMAALSALGSQLGPLTVGIYANAAGAPTGSALVSVQAPAEYVNPAPSAVIFPLPVTGLFTATTYWIVTRPAGNVTFNYQWAKSNQASGTSTSTNGTTWTAQAYGSIYQVFDQAAVAPLTAIWEDSGARWQALYYTANNSVANLGQYTTAQNSSYQQGFRTFTYSNGIPKGWS